MTQPDQCTSSKVVRPAGLMAYRFREIPACRTVPEIIEANTDGFGEYTVVSYEGETFTNIELMERGARFAAALKELGVEPGDRMVVHLANCPDVWVCYLAFSLLGAVLVPTLPSLTVEELEFVLADSGAKALIADQEKVAQIEKRRSTPPGLGIVMSAGAHGSGLEALTAGVESRYPGHDVGPDDLAAIIYTSGTTGKPKGVMLSQRSLCRQACLNYGFYIGPGDDQRGATVLMPLPMSHVFGLAVAMASLLMGNLVVLMRRFDAAAALRLIRDNEVRIVPAVPTMLVRLADQAEARVACRSVVQWDCGGAPLPVEVRERVERELGGVVTEGWGLSETASAAAQEVPDVPRKPGSTGMALPGIEIIARAEDGRDCGPGEIGELLVRGETTMQGYWNRPEATAETLDAEGYVHTGDVGYIDAEGYCFVLGRKDDLIIRGAENISPREVEEVIQRHPDVADVAVIGVPDATLGNRVAAFIVARGASRPTTDSIRDFCLSRLARHKVPERIELLDELPRTSTGKVLRRALRERTRATGGAADG